MLNRTLLFSVFVAVIYLLPLIGTSSSVVAEEKKSIFHVDNAIFLGQDARRNANPPPTFLDRIKTGWSKLIQDDSRESNQRQAPVATQPAVPTTPPRPVTSADITQSQTTVAPQQGQRSAPNSTNTPQPRAGTLVPLNNLEEVSNEGEVSAFTNLRNMRQTAFPPSSTSALTAAANQTRQLSNMPAPPSPSVPPAPIFDMGTLPRGPGNNINDYPDFPMTAGTMPTFGGERTEIILPDRKENREMHTMPRGDMVPDLIAESLNNPSVQVAERIAGLNTDRQREQPGRRVLTTASPRLIVEVEQPEDVAVFQEITFRFRVSNVGDAPAEAVVVNTTIPSWLDVRQLDATSGEAVITYREDGSGVGDMEWKINRLDQDKTDLLILRAVPQERMAIEFPIRHDFYRPPLIARVDVRQPRLEMELLGTDEVLWNEDVIYKLLVHNVGNGNAENVRLDLQQTSSADASCEFPVPLRPGETQEMDIKVRAGREQEYIEIAVLASGLHDLKGEIRRRIRVLRPRLEMVVQTSPLHFVENPAEVSIRVRNIGSADADNVVIKAELPLGARYLASSEGGISAVQQQQNMVMWQGRTIAKGEMQTFTLTCVPQREGECRISVDASVSGADNRANVLVSGRGTFLAKAVVELDWAVRKPEGPVELGQEAGYIVQLTNRGTKAAENIEVSLAFSNHLEPVAVKGGEAGSDGGLVVFEKIPVILPKQTVTLEVIARAEQLGMAPVRVEVVGTDIQLSNGLSTYIFSRTAAAEQTQNDIFR